ncbi:MAG: hypothetical protein Q8S08_02245 [Halomonas sp.]|nr:hypothetical protein [Halomonas sp.]MDP3534189.1 hypothetical protein [Halomonas sp.]
MNLRQSLKAALLTVVLTPTLAPAANFSYSHIGLGASHASIDGMPALLGADVFSRHRLTNNVFLEGGFSRLDGGDWTLDVEHKRYQAALGYATPVLSHADLVFTAGIDYQSFTLCRAPGCSKSSDNGALGSIGVRSWVSDSMELSASVEHVTTGDAMTSLSLEAVGWFDFTSSLFMALDWSSDQRYLSTGYRYTF